MRRKPIQKKREEDQKRVQTRNERWRKGEDENEKRMERKRIAREEEKAGEWRRG